MYSASTNDRISTVGMKICQTLGLINKAYSLDGHRTEKFKGIFKGIEQLSVKYRIELKEPTRHITLAFSLMGTPLHFNFYLLQDGNRL